ncbi:ankyrin repeat-containing domain protein [Rhexocercosporidium sp. MPI-PUGE-AT-0058]|nr:ankyrin repeat-containing domain protein [Rhexocercosporidium sp. MPI-PUGE-AT-0058]
MSCLKEPTLLDSTLARDCMRAAAVLGLSWLFEGIVNDASRDCKHSLSPSDRSAAFKDTVLVFATIGGQQRLVSQILNAHAKTNHDHDRGQISFALRAAVTRGDEELVLLLLEANREDPSNLHHLPRYAAAANRIRIFNLLCERLHAPLNDFRNIREATRHGHTEFVKLCLVNGTDVNENASGAKGMWELESPLQIASSRGYRDIVQLLLAHGANATDYVDQFSSLTSAASQGHCEIIQDLLAAGSIPVRNEKWSPLTSAVRNGQVRAVEVLLDSGVEFWYKDRALSLAAQGGYGTLVKILFERGANIDGASGPSGFHSPMLEALAYGHAHVVEILLDLGAKSVDLLDSHYAEDLKKRGMWPRSPVFGVKRMR